MSSPAAAQEPGTGGARPKLERLERGLARLLADGLVVAFSGGVDSAFLLWAAARTRRQDGGRLVALTTVSESTPGQDRRDAIRFAEGLEVEHLVRASSEMRMGEYTRNDENRCYHCKVELFQIAGEVARERACGAIAYGYTASDVGDVRPGHRAAMERGIAAPLADAGLSKQEIRALMRQHEVQLSEKAASPCLSSRIMTGVEITPERLRDVEDVEAILRNGKVEVFRVRLCGDGASRFLRIEVAPGEMTKVVALREALMLEGKARGYRWVTLDLGGYRTGGGRS